ncbi:hypothetical protein LWC34_04720 [Kibdelosporangium philippinense]|uniref:Uncharacterized protein n=1 Tax=Kibdelosporangium philippinense TaxID=211113 RepID=A0ABS8Z3T1_9PSEU|nr:hypothetical protein [Kibdelosporangium philippinense]MCE7002132.1 hypothetical protein [Kibdelosporangium philippinense]
MLKRFLAWLEDYVADAGVIGLSGAVLGILAFGGTLSAVFGNSGIRAATFTAAILAIAGLFAWLAASRKYWHDRAQRDQRLLAHYCNILHDRFNYWRIKDWDETVVVDERGNAKQLVKARVLVESDDLDFFRVRLGSHWKQPVADRKRVKVKVRSLEHDGIGGTRSDTTTSWLHDGRLEVLTHFNSPLEKNDIVNLAIELDWPRKCFPLMHGEPDDFVMRFARHIEKATWTIILPAGTKVYVDPVGLRPEEDSYEVRQRVNAAGDSELRLSVKDIEPYRRFGVRLDQK